MFGFDGPAPRYILGVYRLLVYTGVCSALCRNNFVVYSESRAPTYIRQLLLVLAQKVTSRDIHMRAEGIK